MLLFILLIIVIIVLICLSFVNFSDNHSTCIYDSISQQSYIYVDNINNIQNIQRSLNNQDNIYYIKNDALYFHGKIIKKLLLCDKNNMKFMNNKYGVKILN
tara:strand:- start:808 stop:1110 length:303 start_codon:yes stop_codon:yes gene_type:complete